MNKLTRAIVCACAVLVAQLALSQTTSGSKQTTSSFTDPWADRLSPAAAPAKPTPKSQPKIQALPPELESFLDSARKAGPQPVQDAMSLIGSRYRWGGMGSRGAFDCSGFVKVVFSKQGINLPRTSRQQAYIGTPVKGSELQPGDLVFFHTSRRSRVTHVGIYAGNGKFIHAANTRQGVRMDDLSEKYYQRRLVTARRVGK